MVLTNANSALTHEGLLTLGDVPLSVLDLAPVPDGSTPGQALRATIDLARRVEELGFTRFWVAEHHGMMGVASSSPPVLISHIAAATTSIRVGSGGVMLPNHSSLVVAGQWPASHPYQRVHAIPGEGDGPDLWLLGSSGYSAQLAGELGLPFAFAHHFTPANTLPALDLYRKSFRPSAALTRPYSMVAVGVTCSDTDEQAKYLAGPSGLYFLQLVSGQPGDLPSPAEAAAYPYSDREQAFTEDWQSTRNIGAPHTVVASLTELIKRAEVDELMLLTQTYDPVDRLRSFELLADAAHART